MSKRVKLTEEQRKANKAEYQRNYRAKNKKSVAKKARAYYKENKVGILSQQKAYKESIQDDYTIVYVIHNYDGIGNAYVGMTDLLNRRMSQHKYNGKLNTDKPHILGIYPSRERAKEVEAEFHNRGLHGKWQVDNHELDVELNNSLNK